VFDLRTVLMRTFALFYPSKQTCTRPTDNYRTDRRRTPDRHRFRLLRPAFGTETSSSYKRVWKSSSARLLSSLGAISPEVAGSQPSSPATPAWIGNKLRF